MRSGLKDEGLNLRSRLTQENLMSAGRVAWMLIGWRILVVTGGRLLLTRRVRTREERTGSKALRVCSDGDDEEQSRNSTGSQAHLYSNNSTDRPTTPYRGAVEWNLPWKA